MMTAKAQTPLLGWHVAVIVILSFFAIDQFTTQTTWNIVNTLAIDAAPLKRLSVVFIIHYFIPMIFAPVLITAAMVGQARTFNILGFSQSAIKGLGFAFIVTLPLAIAFALTMPISDTETLLPRLLNYALFSGTAEEILFRCFLFGLLFRLAQWGFLPAAILGAIIFGAGHIYQGNTLSDAAGIFMITLGAGLWWSWIYVEWDFNAWAPIGLHVFMNGWFNVFEVSGSAQLPLLSEFVRLGVVILSIAFTIAVRRKGGRKITGRVWVRRDQR